MKNGRLKIALVVSLAFNLAVLAALTYGWVRQHPRGVEQRMFRKDRHGPFRGRGRRFARHLNLSSEKTERLEAIFDESHGEAEVFREELHKARGELIDLLREDEPDEGTVMEKVQEISRLQGELEKVLIRGLLRTHAILDQEERERLSHLLMRRMKRWHPGHPGPPGRRHDRDGGYRHEENDSVGHPHEEGGGAL